jgi:hypothetical protein
MNFFEGHARPLQAEAYLRKSKILPPKGDPMNHTATISPQHMRHYSFNALKKYLFSHEELLDDILEKVADAGGIIIVASFIYMIIVIFDSLNHANHAYAHGLSCLLCNGLQNIAYTAQEIFM